MRNIRLVLLAVLLLIGSMLMGAQLNMFVEHHRFLDLEGNTILHLDYQVPYRSLSFVAQHGVFFAELLINVHISQADSVIYQQEITDNVGIRNRYDAGSTRKTHLDRLSFILPEGSYSVAFSMTDKNSGNSFEHSFGIETLSRSEPLSDLELNTVVQADTTQFLPRFKRKGMLYKSEPSILFSRAETDFVHLYFEVNSSAEERDDTVFMSLSVESTEAIVMELFRDISLSSDIEGITLKIPITDLEPGRYDGFLDMQVGEREASRRFAFVVIDDGEAQRFLMPDPDDEARLMRYFIGTRVPSEWDSMSLAAKRNYISSFWSELAAHFGTTVDQALETIRGRVDYANARFTHFSPGWTSDRGRIYIRNGAPGEIEADQSSDETRYVRKDYQIWKYRSRPNAVYLFVDLQMSGNYRLMYVNNDEMEVTNPSWMNYLGEDFDLSKLRN